MKRNNKLSIIIPVYNEKDNIIEVLKKVNKIKIPNTTLEIVVVEDCSKDGTCDVLKAEGLKYATKVLYHKVNQGKGAGLRTGIKAATGDVIIIQDADFEYDFNDIPKVVKPIFNGECEVVYGSRFLNKKYDGYKSNQMANKFLTKFSNLFNGLKLTDMETCYKAFKKDVIKKVDIKENRFGFEPEITAKVAKQKIKIKEVPISYKPRTFKEGKKIRFKDGLRAIWCIIKYNL